MDLQSILTQVIQWHKDSQYEAIIKLLEILIESSNGLMKELEQTTTSTKELATQQTINRKSSLYTYFGDSLYRMKYFRRALRAFEQALSFKDPSSRKPSKRLKANDSVICNREYELRHRIHLCHLELHDYGEAILALDRIPKAERSVKVLSSLADIYWQEKNTDKAKEIYLDLLKQDPLRLDSVIKICKIGNCDANTILELIPDDIKRTYTWYPSWIQAQCYLHSPNSKQAIRLFETLTSRFERRAPILTSLAEAHYHDGNFKEAIRIFQIAHNSDPLTLSGVDSYAACLHKESLKQTLEDLAVAMSSKCNTEGEHFHEPWLALAHYYASNDKKDPKALLFVQKAYKLNRYSIEALILLACLCLEKKDSTKAIPYIVTAQTQAPYRYEVQRILCDTFLANKRKPAALGFAKGATESLGETARSLYLYADIMLKSQDQRRKKAARTNLEKAIRLDKAYLPAVFSLTELFIEEKKFDKAIDILNEALPHHSGNSEIHRYLCTCHTEKKDPDKALYHQNLATDQNSSSRTNNNKEIAYRNSQEHAISQDDVDQILGLEADELVDHGDSEVDDANLDS